MSRRRERSERGATAVIIGILAVVLFSIAALAVDLGNAWARKRAVQTQVDVSAISAGSLLPMTALNKTDIADRVAAYLNENQAVGQDPITGVQLVDASAPNGEVYFQDEDGNACLDDCVRMSVLAPQARVDFGFARVMGMSHTEVQRTATVQVVSSLPPANKMIPFWLPSGCGYGPAQADTSGGTSASAPTTSATPTVTVSATGSASPTGTTSPTTTTSPSVTISPTVLPTSTGTHLLTGASPLAVTQGSSRTISDYRISAVPSNTDRASLRFYSPDGSRYVEYTVAQDKPKGTLVVPPFTIGSEITATSGDWRVYAMVQPQGNSSPEFSATSLVVRVTATASPSPTVSSSVPTSPATGTTAASSSPTTASASPTSIPVSCVGQDRGNFGQLQSPRKSDLGRQGNLAMNLAKGLDHQLVPFVFASTLDETKDCGDEQHGFITGAEPDTEPEPGRNCIISDEGNDGPWVMDGLVEGTDGERGRLDATRGHSSCPNGTQVRTDKTVSGISINDDVLSCFLRNNATLTDLTQATGVTQSMLDPSVVDSPRFVWLPVVYANDRAQKEFQPILQFVPGFITDETTLTGATSANGLDIVGHSVKVLHTFIFNKDALPINEQDPTVDYTPGVARSIVQLIG